MGKLMWLAVISMSLTLSISSAIGGDFGLVKVPSTAVAAFYMDQNGNVVAPEYLGGVTGRFIKGYLPFSTPPVSPPSFVPEDQPPRIVPSTALWAFYLDIESKCVAIETLDGVTGRVVMDLGVPTPDPACCAKCTVNGGNGSYCLPGCHCP